MADMTTIWLPDAENTRFAGVSLTHTLYAVPTDILLTGPLGAGKTSFLQGVAAGLGVEGSVSSPTYALEQRYETPRGTPLLHLDLYRLDPAAATELVRTTDDHAGIRCIEWADRLAGPTGHPSIEIALDERDAGREARISFKDVPAPSVAEIEGWMDDVLLPRHIRTHCRVVADLCTLLARDLLARGVLVRPTLLHRAGLVHDLLRFVDFHPDASPQGMQADERSIKRWREIGMRYPGHHEEACAALLREHGYDALATIVEVHGLRLPSPDRVTIEQQILFYADKRVALDRVVSLDERFEDFRRRYGAGEESDRSRIWHAEAHAMERLLFPDGPPA